MTEMNGGLDGTPAREDLSLNLQYPVEIPSQIRELKLSKQLPNGNLAYIDYREPNVVKFVSQENWKPVLKKGIEIRENIDNAQSRFSGVILHLPERTPENNYNDLITKLSDRLKRTTEREEKIITEQHLGSLFIVEDLGEDQHIGWRRDQLTAAGLVADKSKGEAITITGDKMLIYARREKQHSPINLENGPRSGYMVDPFISEIEDSAQRQGLTADTTALRTEARSTNHPPRTISNLRDGGNTTYTGTDKDGKAIIVEKRRDGTQIISSKDGSLPQEAANKPVKKADKQHQPGETVNTGIKCGDCPTGYFQDEYYKEAGRSRWILKKNTVCHGSHADGYPTYLGKRDQYIRPLGPFSSGISSDST